MLGTSQHLLIDTGKPRKTCVEVAGRRTFRILTSSQQYKRYTYIARLVPLLPLKKNRGKELKTGAEPILRLPQRWC